MSSVVKADKKVIALHPLDNVATAVCDLGLGDTVHVGSKSLPITQDVPFGHKVALTLIAQGEHIIKYGESIGRAIHEISPGQCVHVNDIESQRGRGDLKESVI